MAAYDVAGSGSVRTRYGYQDPASPRNQPSQYPPLRWGMVNNPQGGQAPGVHKAQPLLMTFRWIRAQIGTRVIQHNTPGDAGMSKGQVAGHGPNFDQRNGPVGDSFSALFQNGSPEPIHIARFFRAANTGYSGVNTVGRAANGILMPDGDNAYVLKRPLQRFPTRGPRSVSGAMNPKSRWDDTSRLPSVFVPTTPLR